MFEYLELAIDSAVNSGAKYSDARILISKSRNIAAKNGEVENDYLLTGSSSILKSIECGIAISKILNTKKNIENWTKSYDLLSVAIRNPKGKFDFLIIRSRYDMDC